MAPSLLTSVPHLSLTISCSLRPTRAFVRAQLHQSVNYTASTSAVVHQLTPHSSPVVARRSGNYQPCFWDDDTFLQSLTNPYSGGMHAERAQKLMGNVRSMLNNLDQPFDQLLELIDSLGRLGLAYHFTSEIRHVLERVHNNKTNDCHTNYTLRTAALKFRLLREHGYYVSQDIFSSFRDENGGFNASICDDVKGMLSLYEASSYGMKGESIMNEAMDTSRKYLKDAEEHLDDPYLAMEVKRALEVPLRWKVDRLEARWCIEVFERIGSIDPLLIELAKLDYNSVQAVYQDEIKELSRWWKKTNLGVKASFSRNKLVSSYMWGIGVAVQPRFANARKIVGKSISILALMDDMYDIYGTLDELQLFTDVVERWDINAMNQLPEYMKICFLALFNFVNEIAYDVLKEQGSHVLVHLKNAWLTIIRAYLLEAKWYYAKHEPTLEEYLKNGWVSIAVPMLMTMCYAVETNPIVEKEMEYLASHPDILRLSAMIVRLEDDLGTSTNELERGDVLKSIQCYMRETGASEEAAIEHIKQLTRETWNEIKNCLAEDTPLPESIVEFMVNFGRVSHSFYRKGDGHSVQDYAKELASDLLFQPIHVT